MSLPIDLPELTIVRALTGAGPFASGDTLSVAFNSPTVGRLVPHGRPQLPAGPARPGEALLPETISVAVLVAAGPYTEGDVLTLSYVDPRIARIHASTTTSSHERDAGGEVPPEPALSPTPEPAAETRAPAAALPRRPGATASTHGVRTRLSWSADRVRRFVQVSDKLFTVDRLGWYRHAFAMRLLAPDEISCGDSEADREIAQHLRALRNATAETLGRPLLAAFMPNFSVTPEWLDTLDDPAAARALASVRDLVVRHATNEPDPCETDDPDWTHGDVLRSHLTIAPLASVEAALPLLIANVSRFAAVTEKLTDYRRALIELFGQTAESVETVRLKQMAQPNHTLDDRLWQLVGTVGECFGGLAVA
jgi:hypothetical protein